MTARRQRGNAARRIALTAALMVITATSVPAQRQDKVGLVDFYGYGTLTRDQLTQTLGVNPGEPLPKDDGAIATRMKQLPGVERVVVTRVCCVETGTQLFVGLVRTGAPTVFWHPRPTGAIRVADTVRALYDSLMARTLDAARSGQMEDNVDEGHSLLGYQPAREVQLAIQRYTVAHVDELRRVLRTSSADADRAIAADVLQYVNEKQSVIPDLVVAARDPYDVTRNNAVRALYAFGMLAERRPDLGLRIPYEAIVPLLNSPVWTDRNKTSMALWALTQSRDPALLTLLKQDALGSLVEIARWQSQGHAFPGLLVIARITGMSDEAAFQAVQAGDRDSILSRVSLH